MNEAMNELKELRAEVRTWKEEVRRLRKEKRALKKGTRKLRRQILDLKVCNYLSELITKIRIKIYNHTQTLKHDESLT